MRDIDLITRALRDVEKTLLQHIEHGRACSSDGTIKTLFLILDNPEVLAARQRIERGFGSPLRLVK